jgi:long-chain acyl-CoA synthetase
VKRTLTALWQAAAAEDSGPAYLVQQRSEWQPVSWREAAAQVDQLGHGLLALGVGHGDRVAILGRTTLEWVVLDWALLLIGATVVPIYPTSSLDEAAYILEDAEVSTLIIEDDEQRAAIKLLRRQLPALGRVIGFGDLSKLAEDGRVHAAERPEAVAAAAALVSEDDLLTCIYTSGTTGPPKGCQLTHRNYFSMTTRLAELPNLVRPGDRTVLFLPLAHNFGRLIHFTGAHVGYTIAFCPDIAELADALVQVQPHFLPSVPRVYEKLHAAIRSELDAAGPLKRRVAAWAIGVGRRASARERDGRVLRPALALQRALAERLVFSKVKARLGGELRFGISGGAPISPEIVEFFHALGVLILEGYGLTECTSVALNLPHRFRFGTVGPPIPRCEVGFADDGEILIRDEGLFLGYLRNEEATREAIDGDGWFHTGDIGTLDAGFLAITDRKKDLIATSGGKKISPQNIERLLQASKLVSHALIVGDRRPYITALITLNREELERWTRAQGITNGTLGADPRVRELMQRAVDEANARLAHPEQIKRFAILPRDFSADAGEVTPTLKLKRRVCLEHFAAEIDLLYAAAPERDR